MARSYDVRAVALTIGVSIKWVDNLLSHHQLPGITRSRQGVQRRVSDEGLVGIELTRLLTSGLGVSVGRAAELARTALASRSGSDVRVSPAIGMTLVFHLSEIETRLRERVIDALESVARIRRGRPSKASAGSDP